jgi:branched-chain amino acid transport system substrate-binding protein
MMKKSQRTNSLKKARPIAILCCLLLSLSIVLTGCGQTGNGNGGGSNGGAEPPAPAPSEDLSSRTSIRIGIPTPMTGPLATFGVGTPFMEDLAVDYINEQGGIYIEEVGKKLPIELIHMDTESSSTKASEVAAKLVTDNKVDMLVVRHTPDTVNPVSAVGERFSVPCLSLDAGSNAWLDAGPYTWSYHAFWKIEDICQVFIDMWDAAGLNGSKVGFVFPADPDGVTFRKVFTEKLGDAGYSFVDPGYTSVGMNDFTTIIEQFKHEGVEIAVGSNISPDFAVFWKQAHQFDFRPKMVSMAKSYLLQSDALALGAKDANNLSTEVWWSADHPFKSSLTGQSGREICDLWTAEKGTIWTQPMGYKYASMEIAIDILTRAASLDKAKILEAMATTDMNTLIGPIKFGENHHCPTPVVGGQWRTTEDGTSVDLIIVTNSGFPEIALTGEVQPITYNK